MSASLATAPAGSRARSPLTAAAPWTDEEVAERVLAGEPALFEILMRRHNQRLFRAARGILRRDDEAEDVLQEAWVRGFRELAAFRGDGPLGSWLLRIAVNEALLRRRRGARTVSYDHEDGDGMRPELLPRDEAADPEREAGNGELRAVLRREVDALPDGMRAVFVLREVEGLSTAETAGVLELSEENVKVRLHRARAALRARLDAALGREARLLFLFDGARCDRVVAAVMARIA